ncbi:MAG: divergent PAP2 family protein [Spirochaetaceae bacterium]|jgi:acid phosphatase family membrane protein YuiD|nr:divergent PAP2 family protein [Spirochaetaceae bacterium]
MLDRLVMLTALSIHALVFSGFFENIIFLSAISSWFFAQLIKAIIVLLDNRKKSMREIMVTFIWRTGGMPSSHAALVSGMTTAVAFSEGVDSNLFIVSFFIALIIMRDAMGVRRSSGIQGKTLNVLGRKMAERLAIEFHPIKEVQGHTPLEVILGALLGIFIATALANL